MKNYLQQHLFSVYLPTENRLPGLVSYENKYGWHDYYIGDKLLFSHRKTVYDFAGFPEKLHAHNFYEVDIYVDGNICYIADKQEFSPVRDNIIVIPPGCQHTARMLDNGAYERYVFYFDPELLDFLGAGYFSEVFRYREASCLSVVHNKRAEFYYLRERLMDVLHSEDTEDAAAHALCYAVQLLLLVSNDTKVNHKSIAEIPQKVLDVKHYVDHNFQTINTTAEIATHFFYSREYVSRVFKQHYNINLSEYLVNQKINHARRLLEQGNSVSFACSAAGFKSTSAFINAFRLRTNMTPAEYKRSYKQEQ
jgi:AraC-like DNA-binding protein